MVRNILLSILTIRLQNNVKNSAAETEKRYE